MNTTERFPSEQREEIPFKSSNGFLYGQDNALFNILGT